MARITIFHTSDLHNKLTRALAAKLRGLKAAGASGQNTIPEASEQLRDLKDSHPDSLMLDSGDAIWAGNIFWRPGGEPILDLMNSVPYDAMCIGNREFHLTRRGLVAKMSRARFPVISANLRSGNPSAAQQSVPGALSYVTFHPAGLNVNVFGLSVPCITERMLVKRVSDYFFAPPEVVAGELVPMLRKQSDLLVCLSHIGIKADRELAEAVSGIDIILGGHTHTEVEERVRDTVIFHSGHHAHFVRRVDVEIKAGKVSIETELIPLGKA